MIAFPDFVDLLVVLLWLPAIEGGQKRNCRGFRGLGSTAPCRRAPLWERLQRSEEHTSELQSLMRISYAVFCLKKKNRQSRAQKKHYSIISTGHNKYSNYQLM